MTRRIWFIGLWVVATLVATGVALAAVGSVAGEVVDSPESPQLDATQTSLAGTETRSTSTLGSVTTHAPEPTTSTSPPPSTTSGSPSTAATAAPASSTSTTDAPESPSTTSTTVAPNAMETATYQLDGGWVRIAYGGGVVDLVGAAPNAGFTMDIEHSGPEQVTVEFRSSSHSSKIEAEWEDGGIDAATEEEDG